MLPVLPLEDDELVSADWLCGYTIPVIGVIGRDPLAAMTSHKDAHPAAWSEPVSTAKPAVAALNVLAPLGRWLA